MESNSEYHELESMLKHPRENWAQPKKVDVYARLKKIRLIVDALSKKDCDEINEFKSSCFGAYAKICTDTNFPHQIFHNLMLREINDPHASSDELWFAIGKKKIRMSGRDFCLVTGLKLGQLNKIFLEDPPVVEDGIQSRYWGAEAKVSLKHLDEKLSKGKFKRKYDGLKIAMLLFANTILRGQDQRTFVPNWQFALVEDLDAWNAFAWGHYTWELTIKCLHQGFKASTNDKDSRVRYTLQGFSWAVVYWAVEAIPAIGKLIGKCSQPDALPRALRWKFSKTTSNITESFHKLEQQPKIDAYMTLEPSHDETLQQYYMDIGLSHVDGLGLQHTTTGEEDDGNTVKKRKVLPARVASEQKKRRIGEEDDGNATNKRKVLPARVASNQKKPSIGEEDDGNATNKQRVLPAREAKTRRIFSSPLQRESPLGDKFHSSSSPQDQESPQSSVTTNYSVNKVNEKVSEKVLGHIDTMEDRVNVLWNIIAKCPTSTTSKLVPPEAKNVSPPPASTSFRPEAMGVSPPPPVYGTLAGRAVCLTCGDKGFKTLLIHCIRCQDSSVHHYCLPKFSRTDDNIRWMCAECTTNVETAGKARTSEIINLKRKQTFGVEVHWGKRQNRSKCFTTKRVMCAQPTWRATCHY